MQSKHSNTIRGDLAILRGILMTKYDSCKKWIIERFGAIRAKFKN